jgi:hypothetical protein
LSRRSDEILCTTVTRTPTPTSGGSTGRAGTSSSQPRSRLANA